jgi:hypothetical protein
MRKYLGDCENRQSESRRGSGLGRSRKTPNAPDNEIFIAAKLKAPARKPPVTNHTGSPVSISVRQDLRELNNRPYQWAEFMWVGPARIGSSRPASNRRGATLGWTQKCTEIRFEAIIGHSRWPICLYGPNLAKLSGIKYHGQPI